MPTRSRILAVISALLLCLTLTSCVHVKALKLRSHAMQLYKEGKTADIIPLLEETLPALEEELGSDHPYVAECLNGLGMTYGWVANDFDKSEQAFIRALSIREKISGPEHKSTLETRRNLGLVYFVTGRFDKAEAIYSDILTLQRKKLGPDDPETAETEIFLAQIYFLRGEYKKTEQLLLHAAQFEARKVSNSSPSPADSQAMLGGLYNLLGDSQRSEKYYLEALEIRQKAFDPEHTMIALSHDSLGMLHLQNKEYDMAQEYFLHSLTIKKKVFGDVHGLVGDSFMNLAMVALHQNDDKRAEELTLQAVEIYREALGTDNLRASMAQMSLALLAMKNKDFAQATIISKDLLSSPHVYVSREMLWLIQSIYSVCLAENGQIQAAIFFAKQSVNNIQRLRTELVTMQPGIQNSYLENRVQAFKFLASMLIDQGRLAEAGQALTMLKEDEFFDFIRGLSVKKGEASTRAVYTEVEETWNERYSTINSQLSSLAREAVVLRKKGKVNLSTEEKERLDLIQQELRLARQSFKMFLEELGKELQGYSVERIMEIGAKNLDKLKPMQGVLKNLGSGSVLLHYLITEEQLYIILTTQNVQLVRKVAIKAGQVNRMIMEYRQILQNPASDPHALGKELFDIFFAPVAEELAQAKARLIMLSMDGALRYLPVAALYDGQKYLAEKYALVLFTEAAKASLTIRSDPAWNVVGLGVSREIEGFSPLPSVASELEGIIRRDQDDQDGVLSGSIYLDQNFTLEKMNDVLDQGYSVMHIASHFVFQPGTEVDSYLLLGDGSRLSLGDISDLDMDFNTVELLTLSACETAVGGTGQDGREIEGFGGLAQRQGARAVLATLWPVADRSTGLFMQNLYGIIHTSGSNKAMALQRAQADFIDSEQYSHPFFWAPFILMGNWL